MMRSRWLVLLIPVLVVLVGGTVSIAVFGYSKGESPVPVGTPNASVVENVKRTPLPGHPCGEWSSSTGAVGSTIEDRYGEIRNCALFDRYWVITTLGKKLDDGTRGTGVIAIFTCDSSDEKCLDGTSDHPLSGWSFVTPPYAGDVRVESVDSLGVLLIFNYGHLFRFDVASGQFAVANASEPTTSSTLGN